MCGDTFRSMVNYMKRLLYSLIWNYARVGLCERPFPHQLFTWSLAVKTVTNIPSYVSCLNQDTAFLHLLSLLGS